MNGIEKWPEEVRGTKSVVSRKHRDGRVSDRESTAGSDAPKVEGDEGWKGLL